VSSSSKFTAKENIRDIKEFRNRRQKTKVQALSIAKKCIINKLDLLTNATVVEDAMQFVQQSKKKLWEYISGGFILCGVFISIGK
jgi:hypothetical protein